MHAACYASSWPRRIGVAAAAAAAAVDSAVGYVVAFCPVRNCSVPTFSMPLSALEGEREAGRNQWPLLESFREIAHVAAVPVVVVVVWLLPYADAFPPSS